MKKIALVLILVFFTVVVLGLVSPELPLVPLQLTSYLSRSIVRKIVQIQCTVPNKRFVTLGFSGSPHCATIYPDGGKSCDSGNECASGICYLSSQRRKELTEEQFGKEVFLYNQDFQLKIPSQSGICKVDDIPDCFSIVGGARMENGKIEVTIPICD